MTLLEQARQFREVFQQESLDNISRYGFIKKKLWDMQVALIAEEARRRAGGIASEQLEGNYQ